MSKTHKNRTISPLTKLSDGARVAFVTGVSAQNSQSSSVCLNNDYACNNNIGH